MVEGYEWDIRKAEANLAKHGVSFDRVELFDWDEALVEKDERFPYDEPRYVAFGRIEARLHVLVFTVRHGTIRVIGLRKANKRELKRYGEEKA